MREPGRLDPFPADANLLTADARPVHISDRDGEIGLAVVVTSSGTWNASDGVEVTATDIRGTAGTSLYPSTPSGAQGSDTYVNRGGLYMSTRLGAMRWEGGTTVDQTLAIGPVTLSAYVTAGGTAWLPTDSQVAYRLVSVYETGDGLVYRSAPSDRYVVSSTGVGVDRAVSLETSDPPSQVSANLIRIEVYRSRTFPDDVSPPDEYYLALEREPGTATVFIDSVPQGKLGAPLYTNGDPASANFPPPGYMHSTAYKGHVFWADVEPQQMVPIEWDRTIASAASYTGVTASITSGVLTKVGAAGSIGYIAPGQVVLVRDASTLITYPARVLSATTSGGDLLVTLIGYYGGSNSVPDLASAIFSFYDSAFVTTTLALSGPIQPLYPPWFGMVVGQTNVDSARLFSGMLEPSGPVRGGGGRFLWQTTSGNPNSGTFTSNGEVIPTSGAGLTAGVELIRGGVMFSKYQEPQHRSLGSLLEIGDRDQPVTGMVVIRDAIIVGKPDGVFRISGTPGKNGALGTLRVDPIDPSVRVIGGMVEMDGVAYAISDRGVVQVTSSGVQNISDNVVGDWFREYSEGPTATTPPTAQLFGSGAILVDLGVWDQGSIAGSMLWIVTASASVYGTIAPLTPPSPYTDQDASITVPLAGVGMGEIVTVNVFGTVSMDRGGFSESTQYTMEVVAP